MGKRRDEFPLQARPVAQRRNEYAASIQNRLQLLDIAGKDNAAAGKLTQLSGGLGTHDIKPGFRRQVSGEIGPDIAHEMLHRVDIRRMSEPADKDKVIPLLIWHVAPEDVGSVGIHDYVLDT